MSHASGAPVDELAVSSLLEEAGERVGGAAWDDLEFVEPLGLLIDATRSTGNLTRVGRRVLRSVALRHLRNRLYLRAHLERRPEAAERPLGAPLVITGLPRTGTSLLQNLLARDPRHRFLRLWEALHPVPPGPDAAQPDQDELVAQAERWLERFYALVPEFRAVHPLTPRGPEECDALLQNAFASQHFGDMFDAPAYVSWFHRSELTREYAFYGLQLRVLSGGLGQRRWLLKSPGHLAHLAELLEVLPGARVLHCHRDPTRAVASYASLVRAVRGPNARELDLHAVGDHALRCCATAVRRALAVRGAGHEEQVFDVALSQLATAPVATVERIYDWLGEPLEPLVADDMRAWLAANPRDRHGTHDYEADEFGLGPERVREALAGYLDRFGSLVGAAG